MHVYVCLLASMLYIHVCLSRSRLCHALWPSWVTFVGLWGHLLVWLHPSLLWIVWIRPLVGYTSVALVCLMHALSPLRVMLTCLPCLFCAACLAFFAFLHLLHACLHFHAWVCVSSILQSNGIMDTRSKPTIVLLGHHLLFDNMFVCPHLAPFDSLTFSMISFYLFLCLFASLFLLSLHVHTWSMDTWSKGAIS